MTAREQIVLDIGTMYNRQTGKIAANQDFCGGHTADDHVPHTVHHIVWRCNHPDGGRLTNVLNFPGSDINNWLQGSAPINGLSLHLFNHGTDLKEISFIGIPLEAWTGHRLSISSQCRSSSRTATHDKDLVFRTVSGNVVDHESLSVGAGHYHVPVLEYRRLKDRVRALEVGMRSFNSE